MSGSALSIPNEWKEHFLIKRIEEEDIRVTLEERNAILQALTNGSRFVQIGKYTLMVNSIKSIDPVYEPDNIPPRPSPKELEAQLVEGKYVIEYDHTLPELWDKLYDKKLTTEVK